MAEAHSESNSTKNVLCRYFSNGVCREGDSCTFSHDRENKPSNACRFYLKGECSYGERCRFDHIRPERLEQLRKPQDKEPDKSTKAETKTDSQKKTEKKKKENTKDTMVNLTLDSKSTLCVDAPVFVPKSAPSNQVQPLLSYANVVGTSEKVPDLSNEVCPFFMFSDQCKLGDNCMYVHGEVCEICQLACLHPNDEKQRENHRKECIKSFEADMEMSFAISRSDTMSCGICMEVVWEKSDVNQRRFGILPNCNHCYCLECVRKWRQVKTIDSKTIRSCPQCRIVSNYIIPSVYWVDETTDDAKQKLMKSYQEELGKKPCKYYKQGAGTCPFGNKCFYLHALANGEKQDVGPPKRRRRIGEDGDIEFYLRNMVLYDFIGGRDDDLEGIQNSIHNVVMDLNHDELMQNLAWDNVQADMWTPDDD